MNPNSQREEQPGKPNNRYRIARRPVHGQSPISQPASDPDNTTNTQDSSGSSTGSATSVEGISSTNEIDTQQQPQRLSQSSSASPVNSDLNDAQSNSGQNSINNGSSSSKPVAIPPIPRRKNYLEDLITADDDLDLDYIGNNASSSSDPRAMPMMIPDEDPPLYSEAIATSDFVEPPPPVQQPVQKTSIARTHSLYVQTATDARDELLDEYVCF